MRPLTQQEIDDAPEWANFYIFSPTSDNKPFYKANRPYDVESAPIIHPKFDISEHVTEGLPLFEVDTDGDVIFEVYVCDSDQEFYINEQDSIALAKHFGHYKEPSR
jgi:hypothetical protein